MSAQIGIGGRLAAPPLPHHRAYGSVHGGSIRLSFGRNIGAWETEIVEIVVAQGLLDGAGSALRENPYWYFHHATEPVRPGRIAHLVAHTAKSPTDKLGPSPRLFSWP